MHACMYVRMHACMYACMHACMYVCTHAFMFAYPGMRTVLHDINEEHADVLASRLALALSCTYESDMLASPCPRPVMYI